MARSVLWFKGSKGLNNRVDPLRVQFDSDTGIQDLSVAYNVVHDYTGRISRRKGWEVTSVTSESHSLFAIGTIALFVTGDALCWLGSDFTYSPMRTVTIGAKMSYAVVGPRIYYANGHESGMVFEGTSWSWLLPDDPVVPEGTVRKYSDPPIGNLIAYYNGRMYVVQGKHVWYSEPFGVHLFDLARSYFGFPTEIQMIRPVKTGIFLSDESDTYFLKGSAPDEFIMEKVATYPAIRGTDVEVDSSIVGDGQFRGVGVLWTSPRGICFGTDTGELLNLTERRLTYPNALRGAGIFMNDRYVVTLEP